MFRTTVFALALTAGLSAAPVPKALKKADGLDGTWEVTERHTRGNLVKAAYTIRWVIDGEKLTIERLANGNAAVVPQPVNPPAYSLMKADADGAKGIDYTISYPNGRTVRYPGVYELDGDALKICYPVGQDAARPTECKAGEATVYCVFKRVKSDDK